MTKLSLAEPSQIWPMYSTIAKFQLVGFPQILNGLAQHDSNLSQEFRDLVCGLAKEAGRPNIADYFPALRMIDPQGVRKRTRIYYSKLLAIFDGIINQRLQLRASSKGYKASNDVLDSLLSLTEEDNSEISLLDIKHLLLVIDYLFKILVQSNYLDNKYS